MLILIISHGTVQLFILKVFQAQHRKEITQLIDKGNIEEELILFKFNKADIEKGLSDMEWIEEDEFRIDGEMYDVVKREFKNDFIYLYCFHDKKESILYSGIIKIINRLIGDEQNNARNITVINSLFSEFYFSTKFETNKFYLEIGSAYLPIKTFNLLDFDPPIDTPPPRS